ncbi:MAG: AAA family ATPase, partial [Alteromonadales bacterium]|nr:AAA family ATPase [Alteromonadales bacterium]
MNDTPALTGHKQILVVDNDAARAQQLSTVLSFVGEHFMHCPQEQAVGKLVDSSHILTIILTGNVTKECASLIKENPSVPFILHDV